MKRRLTILTTGGTIAMTATEPQSGGTISLGVQSLLATMPDLDDICIVAGRDLISKPSSSLTFDDLRLLAATVKETADTVDGIVITHGTDTLEETAFALSLWVRTPTPIVITGAMRRADLPGADGAANITAACRVAASPQARGQGILVVIADEIHAGALVRKTHSFRPHAFSSPGPLGWVIEDRVRFLLAPTQDLPLLKIGDGQSVVPIVEAGIALEAEFFDFLATATINGLVLSLSGIGHIGEQAVLALATLAQRIPVIFATRTGAGETGRMTYGYDGGEINLIRCGLIPAGTLDARKARVALLLALANKSSLSEIHALFAAF